MSALTRQTPEPAVHVRVSPLPRHALELAIAMALALSMDVMAFDVSVASVLDLMIAREGVEIGLHPGKQAVQSWENGQLPWIEPSFDWTDWSDL